jgi:hypothetical protein
MLGKSATRRFAAGNFHFDAEAVQWTTHGLGPVTGYVREGSPITYLTPLAFRPRQLVPTITEEEYHQIYGLTSEVNAEWTGTMCATYYDT